MNDNSILHTIGCFVFGMGAARVFMLSMAKVTPAGNYSDPTAAFCGAAIMAAGLVLMAAFR